MPLRDHLPILSSLALVSGIACASPGRQEATARPRERDLAVRRTELDRREQQVVEQERAADATRPPRPVTFAEDWRKDPFPWTADVAAARTQAIAARTVLFVVFDVHAAKELEERVLSTPEVRAALRDFVWHKGKSHSELHKKLTDWAVPTALLLEPTTDEILAGFAEPPTPSRFLEVVLAARRRAGLAPNPAMRVLAEERPQVDPSTVDGFVERGDLPGLTQYLREHTVRNRLRESSYVVVRLDGQATVAPDDLEVRVDRRLVTSRTGLYVIDIERGRVQVPFEVRARGHESIATRVYADHLTGVATRVLTLVPASTATPPTCSPPTTPLPRTGLLVDPYDLRLPDDCVVGGLDQLSGTWALEGGLSYATFKGDCKQGFTPDFGDPKAGSAEHTWSDGTRVFIRRQSGISRNFVTAHAYCLMPDHSLAAIQADDHFQADRRVTSRGERLPARTEPPVRGLRVVGKLDVRLKALAAVAGTRVYVRGGGIDFIDVADPAHPRKRPLPAADRGLIDCFDVVGFSAGGKPVAYCADASADGSVTRFELPARTPPRRITGDVSDVGALALHTLGGRQILLAGGGLAHAGAWRPGVEVLDVTRPGDERHVRTITLENKFAPVDQVKQMAMADETLFVLTSRELIAFELTHRGHEVQRLGERPLSNGRVAWAGLVHGRALVLIVERDKHNAAVLRVIDGSPRSVNFLIELGHYQPAGDRAIVDVDVDVAGQRAYVATNRAGVRVVDLRNPARPVEVGHYAPKGMTFDSDNPDLRNVGVRVSRGLVHVVDMRLGLHILRFVGKKTGSRGARP